MKIRNKILEFINNKNIEEFDPYYIYEEQTIKDHCKIFQNLTYKNKAIHFATMANINPTFLQIVKNEKVNIFVNSVLHLNVALKSVLKDKTSYLHLRQ
jgi:diaminopimelate decarboxylase